MLRENAALRTAKKVLGTKREENGAEERLNTMATSPVPATAPSAVPAPKEVEHFPSRLKLVWQKYGTPLIVLLLAIAIIVTITRNWNGWEGAHLEQVTNDAYVRGDLTPLSTKVQGLVRTVTVNDYQQVRKGELLVQLDDDGFDQRFLPIALGTRTGYVRLHGLFSCLCRRDLGFGLVDSSERTFNLCILKFALTPIVFVRSFRSFNSGSSLRHLRLKIQFHHPTNSGKGSS